MRRLWIFALLFAPAVGHAQQTAARACAGCHADIARKYATTGMARAFYPPTAASVPRPEPWLHEASGTWYEIVARAGAWYQKWWQTGPRGERRHEGEAKIDYVMGSGNHARSYLHRTSRGTLTQLPLAWYAEDGGKWGISPGFDSADPPVGRKVGYDCMFCHNAYPSIPAGHDEAGAEPVYSGTLPQGIDCQRCHGLGARHLQTVARAGATQAEIRSSIVNPARLAKGRAMDVCQQCHLETTSYALPGSLRRYERGPFSFRPGEALSAFELFFDHAEGSGREGKFEIVSSAYRLRQSKCFLESQGAMGCTTCHDPHDVRHGEAGAAGYNQACGKCHEAAKLAARTHPAGGDCVGCHMPKRRAEDVVHAVMTDHLIQRRPAAGLTAAFAERHDAGLEYKGEVRPYGAADAVYSAVAQVTHQSNLQAGIPRLQEELGKRGPVRAELQMELGDALQRAGRTAEAVEAMRAVLATKPASGAAWMRLAMALRAQGQQKEPLDAMRKAVAAEPNTPELWINLGLLQGDLGDRTGAVQSMRKAVALEPESAEAHNGLAGALARAVQVAEAEQEALAALRLRPAMPAAHAQMAYLLASQGDVEEALWHFARAGNGAEVEFSYGVTLARVNRLEEAQVHLQKSLDAENNQPLAHELLGRLLESAGRVLDGVAHYREAIRLQPDFGRAHADLGGALARAGNRAGAAQEFRLAQRDADPEVRAMAAAGLAALGVQ